MGNDCLRGAGVREVNRTEFIKSYAKNSEASDRWAAIGLIDFGGERKIALPCGCGDDSCDGWAMVGIEGILHHLFFNAPEGMRVPYIEIVKEP